MSSLIDIPSWDHVPSLDSTAMERALAAASKPIEEGIDVCTYHAGWVLSDLADTADEVAAVLNGTRGAISIGTAPGAGMEHTARALSIAVSSAPDIQLNILVGPSDFLYAQLHNYGIDLMVGHVPMEADPSGVEFEELGEDNLCIIANRNHELTKAGELSLSELLPYPWILDPPGTPTRRRVEAIFQTYGILLPRRIINNTSPTMAMNFVSTSDGLTAISSVTAALLQNSWHCSILPMKEQFLRRKYGIVRLKRRHPSAAALSFTAILRQVRNAADRSPVLGS